MKPEVFVILGIFVGFGVLELLLTKLFRKPGQTATDGWVELISTITLTSLTQPAILFTSVWLISTFMPETQDALAGLPWLLGFGLFLIFDDMTQYWWHRTSHSVPWLYKLHRPHHNAEYMSIRIVYRNNLFYYAMMPGLWLSGILVFLGLYHVYAVYMIIKMSVIMGAHSDVCWDKALYKISWLSPVMWVVERTISTPSTHHAHHGKHASDPATHYKGNYGNLLFFWDVLFGTAKITRQYPANYGVENLPETSLGEQVAWPLIRTSPAIPREADSSAEGEAQHA